MTNRQKWLSVLKHKAKKEKEIPALNTHTHQAKACCLPVDRK